MTESIELLVLCNSKTYGKEIFKCNSEFEAYKKYKELESLKGIRSIVKAKVYRKNVFNTPFIVKYEVLETII